MSSSVKSQKTPSWLSKALRSEKRITDVLGTLATRESQRLRARKISEAQANESEKHDEVTPSKQSSFSFLRRHSTIKQEIQHHHVQHYSVVSGALDANLRMNRYVDILPYDRTRVAVHHPSESRASGDGTIKRYLNANWVLEKYGHKWWIATQAPLRSTAHAFLSVLLQHDTRPPHAASASTDTASSARVRTVVQLTRNVENGRRKADVYFPTEAGQSVTIYPEEGCDAPALRVTLLETTAIKEAHCMQSTVSIIPLQPSSASQRPPGTGNLQNDGDNYGAQDARDREIIFNHLLYLSWPDHGVPDPENRESLLAFIQLVDRINRDKSYCLVHKNPTPDHPCTELDPDPPVMIGCSAGIGRTGSFIALSSLLRHYGFLLPALSSVAPAVHASPLGAMPQGLEDDLVLQEVDSLREQRPGMVQRNEQAVLVYEVLADMFSDS